MLNVARLSTQRLSKRLPAACEPGAGTERPKQLDVTDLVRRNESVPDQKVNKYHAHVWLEVLIR
jgi:hypothetical protein